MDDSGSDRRPGDMELDVAARSAVFAAVAVVLAQVTGMSSAPIAVSVTFLLWLGAMLAGLRTIIAVWVAMWKRRQRDR